MTITIIRNLKNTQHFFEIIKEEAKQYKLELYATSMYRSVEKNNTIGGSKTSQHLLAKAVDISVENNNRILLMEIIENLIKRGIIPQGGIGLYNNHVHYDWRGKKARWNNAT